MFATFEISSQEAQCRGHDTIIQVDTCIQSLSWMRKPNTNVNATIINSSNATTSSAATEASAKTKDTSKGGIYYQEGWLATGNSNSMVGCTFTSSLTEQNYELIRQREKQLLEQSIEEAAQATNAAVAEATNVFVNNSTAANVSPPATTPPPLPNTNTAASLFAAAANAASNSNANRTNFNLRGHKADIKLVRWNEPYQKLASCDSKGVIYVWVKYEGRWSIELINDRGNCVTDFSWSHDGRMAVICYQDGFVLVGSVNGQRFWSQMYDLSGATITSATWTPNDAFVLLGLSNGTLMRVDEQGAVVAKYNLKNDTLLHLAYNSPYFFNDEPVPTATTSTANAAASSSNRFRLSANMNMNGMGPGGAYPQPPLVVFPPVNNLTKNVNNANYMLACSFKTNGLIYLLRGYDDVDPVIIDTGLEGVQFEWSYYGKLLAVGGYQRNKPVVPETYTEATTSTTSSSNISVTAQTTKPSKNVINNSEPTVTITNYIQFYNQSGSLIYKIRVPMNDNETIKRRFKTLGNAMADTVSSPVFEPEHRFSALAWGHNDRRLFVACSSTLHILRIYNDMPSINLLAQTCIKAHLPDPSLVDALGLPERLRHQLAASYSSTIKSNYPRSSALRRFVCHCLPNNERLHCTMKHITTSSSEEFYTLYLEYLGGLIPLLTARKASKVKPDFVILDPFTDTPIVTKPLIKSATTTSLRQTTRRCKSGASLKKSFSANDDVLLMSSSGYNSATSGNSNTKANRSNGELVPKRRRHCVDLEEIDDGISVSSDSSTMTSVKQKSSHRRRLFPFEAAHQNLRARLATMQRENERNKAEARMRWQSRLLVEVKSNIWGTKFQFVGHNNLPQSLGNIVYKTSLFHLQPRQMTITLDDLTPQAPKGSDVSRNSRRATNSSRNESRKSTRYATMNALLKEKTVTERKECTRKNSCPITIKEPETTNVPIVEPSVVPTAVPETKPPSSLPQLLTRSFTFSAAAFKSSTPSDDLASSSLCRSTTSDSVASLQAALPVNLCSEDFNCSDRISAAQILCDAKIFTQKSISSSSSQNDSGVESTCDIDSFNLPVLSLCSEDCIAAYSNNNCAVEDDNEFSMERLPSSNSCNNSMREFLITSQTAGDVLAAISDAQPPLYTQVRKPVFAQSLSVTTTSSGSGRNTTYFVENSSTGEFDERLKMKMAGNTDSLKFASRLIQLWRSMRSSLHKSSESRKDSEFLRDFQYMDSGVRIGNTLANAPSTDSATIETDEVTVREEIVEDPVTLTSTVTSVQNTAQVPEKVLDEFAAADSGEYEELNDEIEEPETDTASTSLIGPGNNNNGAPTKAAIQSLLKMKRRKRIMSNLKLKKEQKQERVKRNAQQKHKNQFVLHNKPPIWNETSQVYQLDFGGRVTQESAKNFQIEHMGKQVMQFGRIDTNAYTLDFEWPFTTVQAFSIALANITQRLK